MERERKSVKLALQVHENKDKKQGGFQEKLGNIEKEHFAFFQCVR